MDTSLVDNSHLMAAIKRDAVKSRILEAFLESAPQFILQLSIILKSGKLGEFFFECLLKVVKFCLLNGLSEGKCL